MITIPKPRKIAVLRANALGDYIFVLPALQALKDKFPQAEIVLLGRKWHSEYLTNRPGPVDRVVVVPPYPGISEREGFIPDDEVLNRFFSEMQKEEFDMAFQLHGGGKNSNPFLLRLGAILNVGLKTPDAAELDISVPYVYYFSEVLRYVEVVARVGAKPKSIEPEIAPIEQDLREARKVLGENDKPIAVIHPGASDLRRHWPAERFARIADLMVDKGYLVCVTGMPFEKTVVDRLLSHSKHRKSLLNLCGRLSLNGMTGLLSMAGILISNDTGPLHLARALKIPTVGIYWCGNIITGLPMSTAIHRSLLSFKIDCPLCGLSSKKFGTNSDNGSCRHETSFVSDVSTDEVADAVEELVALASKKEIRINSSQSEAA